MILDSNLVIYAARLDYPVLRQLITERLPVVSALSMVEVLGDHKLLPIERSYLKTFFASAEVLPLSDAVVARAVGLRQVRKRSLGGALVAATALVFGRELLTRNLKDFADVPGLAVTNPLVDDKRAAPE